MEQVQESGSHISSERVDEIDRARAQEYALLATLLSCSPDAQMIGRLVLRRGDASQLGVAHAALGEAAGRTNEDNLGRDYFDLFIGLGGGLLLPYASHYLTGALYGRPLGGCAKLFGISASKKPQSVRNREVHATFLCEIMAGLVGGGIAFRPALIVSSLRSISLAGSGVFLSIWGTLNQLTFTLAWAR
jgi:TorA maturation chaperone TorD